MKTMLSTLWSGRMRPMMLGLALVGGLGLGSCDRNGNVNVLSVEDDKKLGAQTAYQIDSMKAEFPMLPETGNGGKNEQAYAYLRSLTDKILNSGKLTYRNEFAWQVKIIQDDKTLNAFCTPGGYIYVYTGLIKFLDTEDQLAGVMGHEIGHADLRHTSRQITQQYGYDLVLAVLLGNNAGTLVQIARGLKDLKYSRTYETEADEFSVRSLAPTPYQCNGAAGFFEKIVQAGDGRSGTPVFLSTHPAPENRVANINKTADKEGCNKTPAAPPTYQDFKNMLP